MRNSAFVLQHRFGNLLFSLTVAVGLLGSATAASAQTSLDVNVPFAFSANHQHLPAGSYRVQLQSQCYVSIRDIKTSRTIVVMVRPEEGRMRRRTWRGPGQAWPQ